MIKMVHCIFWSNKWLFPIHKCGRGCLFQCGLSQNFFLPFSSLIHWMGFIRRACLSLSFALNLALLDKNWRKKTSCSGVGNNIGGNMLTNELSVHLVPKNLSHGRNWHCLVQTWEFVWLQLSTAFLKDNLQSHHSFWLSLRWCFFLYLRGFDGLD